jgi:hypothetical protein
MDETETMSAKEVMEGVKALNELMNLFKGSQVLVGKLMPEFVKTAEGNHAAWFDGIEKVSDLAIDDAQGALIITLTVLGQIKVKIRDTPAQEILKDVFTPPKES